MLNALRHAEEAEIVAQGGQPERVTVATNMAGRGTDIHLVDSVRTAGGLHVIATELHSSSRIDRQLIGRAARQGDPGSYQFFLSLEDELLRGLGAERVAAWQHAARPNEIGELPRTWLRLFRSTQRTIERREFRQRRALLRHERDLMKRLDHIGLDPFLELVES